MIRRLLHAALLVVLAAMLGLGAAACGKRGSLEPPAGEPSDYPRKYPRD